MNELIIRNETKEDYFAVENLTREAFWNVYKPGCDEHLVLHQMRSHESFIPALDFVVVENHRIVGNIVYSKASVKNHVGHHFEVIMFGPVAVLPSSQHRGIGRLLIETSMATAKAMGYKAVFITGNPQYYAKYGFQPAFKYGIHYHGVPPDYQADFFMVKELGEDSLKGVQGVLYDSPAFVTDPDELVKFDKLFPKKIKRTLKGQLHI